MDGGLIFLTAGRRGKPGAFDIALQQALTFDVTGNTRFSEDGERYRRTIPKFHAPQGKYDWLNKSLFAGTITSIKSPRAVIIRVYEID